ncbi:MAG: 3-deoxy-7-phosphoheptulonate synthase [Candidatus Acididesulfobacter diazotrophicus]|jgi:3-deoxy-7-phosphoheptulonate synthase|uniref:3-deoxy-7-phosphoheptulonate synthase n=1 Tax=Candidatus Acididesulfobacter diazotrophicus TaxID=2597226 RepID=A0A519BPL8_9DELT|nr:MAG: 3-deoxy-7-phosphoheptulonate synthase [Candidatus Acididesulfobacter diazotrophicus]
MILVLKKNTTENEFNYILKKIDAAGLKPHISKGEEVTIIGCIGVEDAVKKFFNEAEALPGVDKAIRITKPYKLASKEIGKEKTVIKVGNVSFGAEKIVIIAGPCAIESLEGLIDIAEHVKGAGSTVLRGGAFKPRTSPYSFQGLGEEGLKHMQKAKEKTGMLIATEVMDPRDLELICSYADILQIGARNMQNFRLLQEVGKVKKPVILKRGLCSTIQEFLMSAEYIMSNGNEEVILCERGIRTYETATRNTLDLSAIPVLKRLSHLPVIVDPSHAAGTWQYVGPLSLAAIAVGADGLMIEVHPIPEEAFSDGTQSLKYDTFKNVINQGRKVAEAVGRSI